MTPIRIGQVEYRQGTYLFGTRKDHTYDEVVVWYKNPQYKTEKKLKKDGWIFDKDGNAKKDNCTISSGCFKSKELCYTVAFIDWNTRHDEFDVRSVGRRAFELKDSEYKNFKQVLEMIESNIGNDCMDFDYDIKKEV